MEKGVPFDALCGKIWAVRFINRHPFSEIASFAILEKGPGDEDVFLGKIWDY
jgi:hypothetical protein